MTAQATTPATIKTAMIPPNMFHFFVIIPSFSSTEKPPKRNLHYQGRKHVAHA
jgi:hypothetical protein